MNTQSPTMTNTCDDPLFPQCLAQGKPCAEHLAPLTEEELAFIRGAKVKHAAIMESTKAYDIGLRDTDIVNAKLLHYIDRLTAQNVAAVAERDEAEKDCGDNAALASMYEFQRDAARKDREFAEAANAAARDIMENVLAEFTAMNPYEAIFPSQMEQLRQIRKNTVAETIRLDAKRWRKIKALTGHVEDSSNCTVKLFQDDATKTYFIQDGNTSHFADSGYDAVLDSIPDPET